MSDTATSGKNDTDSTETTDEFFQDEYRFPAERARGTMRSSIADARIFTENADRGYYELLPIERELVEIVAKAEEGDASITATLSLSPGEARRLGRYLFESAQEAERTERKVGTGEWE